MTTISMAAREVAHERQLDWLLGEVLGSGAAARSRAPAKAFPWLAAAVAVLAMGVAIGVAVMRGGGAAGDEAQDPPATPFHECHGVGEVGQVPADVTALKCFDFDDAACAHLAKFTKLERLDLSGTDVNDQGYSVALKITDAGVRELATLTNLRWLSLATCHDMKGEGLQALEALPRLEHLDLTYSGIESPAIERLPRLPSLRTLVLSHCMNFHGRSLAAVATIPGLRRLELRGCTTLAAKDVLTLAQCKQLRYLDLRDCQGRFRGQTARGLTPPGAEEPPPPPEQDGIGITDAVVAALAALPLETLLLGGSESLTDAIGDSLAKMTSLRSLDLSNLPKTTGALWAKVPGQLTSLALDDNPYFTAKAVHGLPPLAGLRELGLAGLTDLQAADLEAVLRGKSLLVLRLSGTAERGKGGVVVPKNDHVPQGAGIGDLVASQRELRRLELRNIRRIDPAFLAVLAGLTALPNLAEIDLTNSVAGAPDTMRELGRCRALRSLKLMWCRGLTTDGLRELTGCPLAELDVYGTKCDPAAVRKLATEHWPGCRITLPNGQRFVAPK